tara:strand:- start:588 stop:983 length:396 start_codon:yes stop_codon:yes gene_type:complete
MKKRAMFIGRWQPFHNGHRWLVDQKLSKNVPILIAVRDIPPDEKNPLTTSQTINILKKMYVGKDVEVMVIPDIESVNYGRGVGYKINEYVPPKQVGFISATGVRKQIREGDDNWRLSVDPQIQPLVEEYLK